MAEIKTKEELTGKVYASGKIIASLVSGKGAKGDAGAKGDSGTISIGEVKSGEIAEVTNSGTSTDAIFDFVLPKGEKGDKGDKGADGTGVNILGIYATEEELNATHPTGNIGDTYMIGENLYVWNATNNEWFNVGGIKGEPGKNGIDGKSATISVGTTTSGNNAKVTNSGTGNDAVLDFVLPIPKTTASEKGNTIKTEIYPNTTYQPINLTLDGRSTQETRSGNLFKGLYTTNLFINLSSNYYRNANNVFGAIMEVKPNTTYTIKRNGGNRFALAESNLYPAANVACNLIIYGEGNENEYTFTTKNDTNYIFFYYSNENANIEITLTTENTPSPDYPSEIESVGYTNLFDVNKISEKTALVSADGSTPTSSVSNVSDYIEVKANKTYILTFNYDSLANSSNRAICYFDKNKAFLSGGDYYPPNKKATITPIQDGYIRFAYDMNCYNIQVADGEYSYIPYGKYGIEVESSARNLLNNIATSQTINGVNFTVNPDKTITVNGKTTAQIVLPITDNIVLDGDYRLSGCPIGGSSSTYELQLYGTGNAVDYGNNNAISKNPNGVVRIVIRNGVTVNNLVFKPQLEKGETQTEYQQYGKNTSLLLLNEPLRSLPNGFKDIAYIRNNKLYVERKVGSILLNGSENWEYWSVGVNTNTQAFRILNIENIINNTSGDTDCSKIMISNYFSPTIHSNLYTNDIEGMSTLQKNIYFRISKDKGSNLDQFKTWLSTHNTEVIYELATPTTEEIGDINFQFVKGENNITNNFDTYMTLEYYTELKGDIGEKSNVIVSSEEPTTGEEVWLEKGRNLFNLNKAKLGWGLKNNATTGGFVEDANWLLTEPIPVEAGKSYFTSGFYFANGDEVISKEFYDKDMNFILYTKTNPMVAPENAAYMFTDSRIDKLDNPMIIQGKGPISYEPYKRKIHTKHNNGLYEEFYNEENYRKYEVIYEGSILVGGTMKLNNAKRFLDVYYSIYPNSIGCLTGKYTIDTNKAGVTYGSTVALAHDSTNGLEYYVDESSFDSNTKILTHTRSGYFNVSSGTYVGRDNSSYTVYRIETYN